MRANSRPGETYPYVILPDEQKDEKMNGQIDNGKKGVIYKHFLSVTQLIAKLAASLAAPVCSPRLPEAAVGRHWPCTICCRGKCIAL